MKKILCAAIITALLTGCGASSSLDTDKVKLSANKVTGYDELEFSMTSSEIASAMKCGWNLGNALETGDKADEYTAEFFTKLHGSGINAVRIPVTWYDHIGKAPTYTIDEEWLETVHSVVDSAMGADLYVILSVYNDGGTDKKSWIRDASADFEEVGSKYAELWAQIAESFSGYSGKLLFESMNDVGFDGVSTQEAYLTLNSFNQNFVDVVRGSGGNNDRRHLIAAGYRADTDMTCSKLFEVPVDNAGKTMVSIHYYTPWSFTISGTQSDWGSDEEVKKMQDDIEKTADYFVKSGTTVVITEFGTGIKSRESGSVYYAEMLTKLCSENGIPCFLWDGGEEFDRKKLKWNDEKLIEAMKRASSGEEYKVTKIN